MAATTVTAERKPARAAATQLRKTYPYYFANEPVEANTDLEVTNKYTGKVVSRVAQADSKTLRDAIGHATKAFEELRHWPPFKRKNVLEQVVSRLKERRDELAFVLAVEAGKPINDAKGEVTRAIDTFTIAKEESTRMYGEYQPLEISGRAAGYNAMWKRFPVGPCSFITPWNFPLNLVAHKVAPALAIGCTWVLKPASTTPISAIILGEILAETDLPKGAFSVLPVPTKDADPLVEDERIRHLSFTGSPEVGWKLKARSGMKTVTLELGGNAGCIVDQDADLDYAVKRLITGAFYQSGQSCISVQRILGHRKIYDQLRDRLKKETEALKMGDPLEEETFIGPIISEDDAKRIESWVNEAVDQGAKVLAGGKRDGNMFEATILENVPHDAKASCQEIFGPVATLEPFTDFDEAVRIVDDSPYGIQAGVFTQNINHAFRAFNEIEAGGIVINDVPSMRVDAMPYGGVKASGQGREGIRFAMNEMSEIRLLVLNRIG